MAIVQCLTTSFRKEILQGVHDLTTDTIKVALYGEDASLGKDTTAYSTTNEVTGTGYTAGGKALTGVTISDDAGVAYVDFDNPSWTNATISARAALLYNSSQSDKSIAVIDFGELISAHAEEFRLNVPNPNGNDAIIRIP